MDVFTAYDDGLMFAHSSKVLFRKHIESRQTGNYSDFSLFIPAMVNGVFACELFIKSLFTKNVRGHKLNDLLHSLESEDKQLYNSIISQSIQLLNSSQSSIKYDESSFINELNTVSDAFVELRYFYEPNGMIRE